MVTPDAILRIMQRGSSVLRIVMASPLAAAFASLLQAEVTPPAIAPKNQAQAPQAHTSELRQRYMPPGQIIEEMKLRSGTKILDIGAGYGLFSFPLADAVGSNGQVFATDVDEKAIAFLKSQAAERKVANLFPVLVRMGPLDQTFYANRVFDVVLASDILPMIRNPRIFFQSLMPNVASQDGRLWVIDLRCDANYSALEITRDGFFVEKLLQEPAKSILLPMLSAKTKAALARQKKPGVSEWFQAIFIEDLNRLLQDDSLWSSAKPLSATLSPIALSVVNKLQQSVRPDDSPIIKQTALRITNRYLIGDMLGPTDWQKAFALDKMNIDQVGLIMSWCLYSQHQFPALMNSLGYKLESERTILPFHFMWVFSRP